MDVKKELQTLGFVRVGTLAPDTSGKGCRLDLNSTAPSRAVWVFVVEDEIVMIGAPARPNSTLEARMKGAERTINEVLLKGRHRDATEPFKRFAPKVVAEGKTIVINARKSTADSATKERDELNDRFNPLWWGRRRG